MCLTKIFDQVKFEQDNMNVYYLPRALREALESSRPLYLIGSRGTGKTTLLKALNWRERLHNRFLREQLGEDPFVAHFIGIYIKLSPRQPEFLARWLATQPDYARASFTGRYFELISIEAMSEAVSKLLAEGVIATGPTEERTILSTQIEAWPPIRALFQGNTITVREFYAAIRSLRQSLDTQINMSTKMFSEVVDTLPGGHLGEVLDAFGSTLAEICDPKDPGKWFFKICFDEAECLNREQQTVLHTLVRHSKRPVLPLVAFVRVPETIADVSNPYLRLQPADRELLVISADPNAPAFAPMADAGFQDLVNGIINVRLKAEHPNSCLAFSVTELLGPLNLNGLLARLLRISENPDAPRLLQDAAKLKEVMRSSSESSGELGTETEGDLPIYQAYLASNLGLDYAKYLSDRKELRRFQSTVIRKKMVAAFLAICRDFGRGVPYASSEMVLQISDGCVRDFLFQMCCINREVAKPIQGLLAERIAPDVQIKAIRQAGARKRELLPQYVFKKPAESDRLIDALAQLTALLQSSDSTGNLRHLRSIERGRFLVEYPTGGERPEVFELLKEAHEFGYLRLLETSDRTWRFRVHCSLAPAYGFSYRGAQYDTRLSITDIIEIASEQDESVRKKLIEALYNKVNATATSDTDQGPTLFDVQ